VVHHYYSNRHNLSFDLKGNKITCEENVKLLGITVDSHLNFDKHISEICKKSIPTIKYPLGLCLWIILNVSTAIVLNLRIFKDGNLDFLSKFS
jgi:hypothetical protein